jgi:acid phosphatase (class A)
MKITPVRLTFLAACIGLVAGWANFAKPEIPANVPELRPGVVAGYLKGEALSPSLSLLSPPPVPNSAAFAADEEAYRNAQSFRDTARWVQATQDAQLRFPQAAEAFSCALDAPISQQDTPHLYMLMRRSLTDSGLSTYGAKNHYQRIRPFVAHDDRSCTPNEEASLSKDGSYPSGHSAIGWTWALILSEVAPNQADPLLARGLSFGDSRIICGVHWQSDVSAGRVIGASTVARLHGDPVFLAELEEAKKEVAKAHAKGLKPTRNCQLEAASLIPARSS